MTRATHPILVAGVLAAMAALLPGRAGAAALPRRAAEPEPHGACDRYGPGFHALAGTDTCVRLGGSVEVEATVNGRGGSGGVGAFLTKGRR